MTSLQTIRQNISNKSTVLPLLFTYGNDNTPKPHSLCIFYDLTQYDADSEILPQLQQDVINTLVSYYGREDMNALNMLSQFMPESAYSITANNITEYWTAKAKEHIETHYQYSNTVSEDYFFMFLPKSIK